MLTLLDTGSTHTLIDRQTYNHLPRPVPLTRAPRVQSISGHDLSIVGACVLPIGGRPREVLVCESLGIALLLGMNVLYDSILNLKERKVQIGDKEYPLDTTPETFQCFGTTQVPDTDNQILRALLRSYHDVFSARDTPIRVADGVPKATIETGSATPIRQNPYRLPFAKRKVVDDSVRDMLNDGIIRPSTSPWASPITLAPKKDGTTRFCVDYRKLNEVTRKDAYPLPHIQDVFDQLVGATVFSTLDLRSGYWQFPMAEESIAKTAFTCHLGLFEFVRMPFGLSNAPAIFQRTMNKVLSGLIGVCCMVYIDDIVIYSTSINEHMRHLDQVFQRLRSAGLQLKPSKCSFLKTEIELLGYTVSARGISPLPDKVSAIQNLIAPTDKTAVRSFLGMAGYYRQCIQGFATLAVPLQEAASPKKHFIWGPEQENSFQAIKKALTTAPILAHPDPTRPYILYTDASDKCIGAILVQRDNDGIERVIHYLSHTLSGAQLSWPTIEKEAYAVVYALKKLHAYLWGATFEIHTDHKPLLSLFLSEIKNTKIQRWAIQISEYGAPIKYHPGKLNVRADMLSRAQMADVCATLPTLPIDEENSLTTTPYLAETTENVPFPTSPTLPSLAPAARQLPTVWEADGVDVLELQRLQEQQFPSEREEAKVDLEGSPYILEENILYSMGQPYKGAEPHPRLILPQQYRGAVIDRCHGELGHAGFDKTLRRVQEYYVWPGMRKHIREYLATCSLCRTLTPPNQPEQLGRMPTPPAPFHTWGMDLVGPFPRDKTGKQYLLTAVDHLTGWAIAVPIASKKNATVWEAFNTHLVAMYGIPAVLITDNGGEFCHKVFEDWLKELGIEHHLTSPYNPQANGACERFNGTLQRLLLKLTVAKTENGVNTFLKPSMLTGSPQVQAVSAPTRPCMDNYQDCPESKEGTQPKGKD